MKKTQKRLRRSLETFLFQIVFHCQLAKERKEFDMSDVIETISDKMLRRHPHVFGKTKFKSKGAFSQILGRGKTKRGQKKGIYT